MYICVADVICSEWPSSKASDDAALGYNTEMISYADSNALICSEVFYSLVRHVVEQNANGRTDGRTHELILRIAIALCCQCQHFACNCVADRLSISQSGSAVKVKLHALHSIGLKGRLAVLPARRLFHWQQLPSDEWLRFIGHIFRLLLTISHLNEGYPLELSGLYLVLEN